MILLDCSRDRFPNILGLDEGIEYFESQILILRKKTTYMINFRDLKTINIRTCKEFSCLYIYIYTNICMGHITPKDLQQKRSNTIQKPLTNTLKYPPTTPKIPTPHNYHTCHKFSRLSCPETV